MDDSVWALIIAILVDLLIFSLEFYLFSVYRTVRNRPVFLELEGKDVKVPVFSESDTPLMNLFRNVWNVPYEEIGFYCGLEGKLYLALHKVLAQSVALMAAIGCIVLIPIYYFGDSEIDKEMNMISMAHIIQNDDKMAVVLIYFVLFSVIALGAIFLYYRQVYQAYSMPSELICTINKYTIEIRGLPQDVSPSDAAIEVKDLLCEQFPSDIQSVYVVPNLADSYVIHLEIEEAKKELLHYQEYVKSKGEKAMIRENFYSKQVDAIGFYQDKIQELMKKYSEEIELRKDQCSGYAYVLAKNPMTALKIVSTFKSNSRFFNSDKWILSIAPAPSEINWSNISDFKKQVWIIRILLLVLFIIFFFLLVTPATLLQILIEVFEVMGLSTLTEGLMNQLLPSLILLLYQSAIVRHTVLSIVTKEQLGNKSEETVSAMFKYLLVMITYTFLVPLIGLQVYSLITDSFVGGFEEWQSGFANQAAFSGLFFTIFIVHLIFLKNGSDFMQIPKLIRVKFRQLRAVNDRERLMAYEAYEFRWAYEYGVSLSGFVIIISFSVAYPLILIIGVFFFMSRYFTAKYNMLCFYCTVKTTTGHKIPKVVISTLLIAILIFQIFTCAMIYLTESYIYFLLSTLLLVLSIIFFLILYHNRETFENDLQKFFKSDNNYENDIVFGEDIRKYFHPLESNGASRVLVKKEKSDSENQLS